MQQPFTIRWTDKSLVLLLICSIAYWIGISVYLAEQGRTRDGAEHGSATWASPAQVKARSAMRRSMATMYCPLYTSKRGCKAPVPSDTVIALDAVIEIYTQTDASVVAAYDFYRDGDAAITANEIVIKIKLPRKFGQGVPFRCHIKGY